MRMHSMASPVRLDAHATALLFAAVLVVTRVEFVGGGVLDEHAWDGSYDTKKNVSWVLRVQRERAEERWRRGKGLLWFQHYRRGGGTTLCRVLRLAVPLARFPPRSEACQPPEWQLRDAMAMCDHNASLIPTELEIFHGNAFAQEYGPIPGPELLSRRTHANGRVHDFVFVATFRDPWTRFWSQLQYELAPCLANHVNLAMCMGGDFADIGDWWSPTAHPDSVLGIPGARLGPSPRFYIDNYYTRVLLNRTDVKGQPPLTDDDLEVAKMLLRDRVSAIVILEDFARSTLQLACSLGLDVEQARPLLRTRVRPYEAQEALMAVPDLDDLGKNNTMEGAFIDSLRARFQKRNKYDYTLYTYARLLSKKRVFACARRHPGVRELWRMPESSFTDQVPPPPPPRPREGDALPDEMSVDDIFGCHGGNIEVDNATGQYMLYCPRSVDQASDSWWRSQRTDGFVEPQRQKGQKEVGEECWSDGFSWAICCSPRFGKFGNVDCWEANYTYDKCCIGV